MNKALLEYTMKVQGVSAGQLCKHLGINRTTLWKKVTGRSEFRQSEIQSIIEYLKIDDPTPIFFAEKVS